jgi:nitronate monooxygenase
MWPHTKVSETLGIQYPILQAGMAGGVTTPQLVAAVSNAGGLGTLGAGYMSPEQIRTAIREIRSLTKLPFAVNLFIPNEPFVSTETIEQMNQMLQTYRTELGIDSPPRIVPYAESFDEQIGVILEEKVPIFSFTFGIPDSRIMQELKANEILVSGTATTVREALMLEQSGADMIVAQGSEAGGHRGTFAAAFDHALIGTMALVPQIVDQVNVPVIASGGIMDGRGIMASLALGASGVQMGTAFLTCTESGAHPAYKQAILHSTEESTQITRTFSGKPARGIRNRFMEDMQNARQEIPAYPVQNALTRDIRQAAGKQNKPEYMSLWAGQASPMSKPQSVSDLMNGLLAQVSQSMRQFK